MNIDLGRHLAKFHNTTMEKFDRKAVEHNLIRGSLRKYTLAVGCAMRTKAGVYAQRPNGVDHGELNGVESNPSTAA